MSCMILGIPFAEFVELPPELLDLDYSIIVCGAIRGALHSVQLSVECVTLRDEIKGQGENEIRLTLKEVRKINTKGREID
jgi:hypothetical protein